VSCKNRVDLRRRNRKRYVVKVTSIVLEWLMSNVTLVCETLGAELNINEVD
jgi:hypothetical protein